MCIYIYIYILECSRAHPRTEKQGGAGVKWQRLLAGPIPQYYHKNYHKCYQKRYHNLLTTSIATRRRRRVGVYFGIARITQRSCLASGDPETLRTEAEDKGLDSNGDAETLHAEAKDNLLDTIEEWALSKSGL